MRSNYMFTSESVSEGHPDKVSDQISDAILDAIFKQDPRSRVAAETLCNTGLVVLAGEITTNAHVDYIQVARDTIKHDDLIDELTLSTEEAAIRAIALQAPVAGDLRYLLSVMTIAGDLERCGDLALRVAKQVFDREWIGRADHLLLSVPGPFDPDMRRRVGRSFDCPALTMYGSAETGPVFASHPSWYLDESVGIPITNAHVVPVDPRSGAPLQTLWELVECARVSVGSPAAPRARPQPVLRAFSTWPSPTTGWSWRTASPRAS